ncbi:MAG: hypothetical protein WCS43_05660 [Verrucomicrobiota bacterium]
MKDRKRTASKPASNRYGIVLGLITLGLVVFIVVRNLGSPSEVPAVGKPTIESAPEGGGKNPASAKGNDSATTPGRKATRDELRKARPHKAGVAPTFPLVEAILVDEKITDTQAAVGFREIAQRADVSEPERLQALTHGLNLNFESFAGFAKDKSLPLVLAQKYFDELANLSPSEAFQISGWLDLLSHEDTDISAQAAGKLATAVDDDSLAANPDALRRAAAKHLEMLKSQPQVP